MTEKLPTKDQFIKANLRLGLVFNQSYAVLLFDEETAAYIAVARGTIKDLGAAAALLGYELVQRVPIKPETTVAEEVNGGGRLDMARVADA